MPGILVIIPAFNEAENIEQTIASVRAVRLDCDIVVVDDGSSDDTAARARRKGVAVLSLPFNLGIGGAVQTGFKFARDRDYDYAVQVDADGQHDPDFLPDILEPVRSGGFDMAIGSRFLPPFSEYRSSWTRRVGIHFFAWLISGLTRYRVTDPTSGFRAFNRGMISVFADYYPSDFPEPEAIAVAGRHRARVCEVPVKMRKRAAGSSSIRYFKTLYYMVKVTFAILLDRGKRSRPPVSPGATRGGS